MLSYTLSILMITILLLSGISYLLKGHFPAAHKASGKLSKLACRSMMKVLKWLGWGRILTMIYLFFAVIFTLSILRHFFGDFFENVGKLIVIWVPGIIMLRLRKFLKERRNRRYELPGRRNQK